MSTRYSLEFEGNDEVVYEHDSISGTKKIAVMKDRFLGREVRWIRDGYDFEIEDGAGPIKATINGVSGYFEGGWFDEQDFIQEEDNDETSSSSLEEIAEDEVEEERRIYNFYDVEQPEEYSKKLDEYMLNKGFELDKYHFGNNSIHREYISNNEDYEEFSLEDIKETIGSPRSVRKSEESGLVENAVKGVALVGLAAVIAKILSGDD